MRAIKLDENNKVVEIKFDVSRLLESEIESETAQIGQVMQPDGTFIDSEPTSHATLITLEELQANQLILMDALATIYEEMAKAAV